VEIELGVFQAGDGALQKIEPGDADGGEGDEMTHGLFPGDEILGSDDEGRPQVPFPEARGHAPGHSRMPVFGGQHENLGGWIGPKDLFGGPDRFVDDGRLQAAAFGVDLETGGRQGLVQVGLGSRNRRTSSTRVQPRRIAMRVNPNGEARPSFSLTRYKSDRIS
jgi:hypothetical protein